MRIIHVVLLSFGISLLLAACGSDKTVTERTTTRSQNVPSDSITTERKTTVDD
jgi:hypothetical protein